MHIVLLCATQRGLQFLDRLARLAPTDRITVFSFREEPDEPRYFEDIRRRAPGLGAAFREGRAVYGEAHREFWQEPVDLLFAVSWRYLVPRDAYERVRMGAYVFHDSLLPRNRGFAPTVWAIAHGEDQTGVTLFRMADPADTGDIVAQRSVPIEPDDTIRTVMDRVTISYLSVLEDQLPQLKSGTARLRPQSDVGATYNPRRTDADNRIEWPRSAGDLHDLIRAVARPYPGAWTTIGSLRLLVWSSRVTTHYLQSAPPGVVVEVLAGRGAIVATGRGSLLVEEVQLVMGEQDPRGADEVLRPGMHLGT